MLNDQMNYSLFNSYTIYHTISLVKINYGLITTLEFNKFLDFYISKSR